jgi:hypothetical protein
MKKKFALAMIMACSLCVAAQRSTYPPGWVTIKLNDFMCSKATADDPLNFDGWGDEVYFVLFYSVANQYGVTKYSDKLVSTVYGDINRFPGRTLAGQANPDNKSGGILSGSQFFPGTTAPNPTKIRLEAGDFITVIPTIWEFDNNSNSQVQASFESRMINSFNAINLKMVDHIRDCYGHNNCYQPFNTTNIGVPSFTDILRAVNGANGSRPIGMNSGGDFIPIVFGLNSQMIKSQGGPYPSDGKTYTWNYQSFGIDESSMGNTRDHGSYRLRFHFTFEEDLSKPAPPPAPTSQNNTLPGATVIKTPGTTRNATINNGNMQTAVITKMIFPGNWLGTRTTDTGLYPDAFGFELTNSNEFIMKVQSTGAVACRGTYTVSGTSISGSYKQFSSGETFSFTGSYDPNTQKMTCTQGAGSSTTGQGKWVVTKN